VDYGASCCARARSSLPTIPPHPDFKSGLETPLCSSLSPLLSVATRERKRESAAIESHHPHRSAPVTWFWMFGRVRGSRSGKKLEARGLRVKGILCVVESPSRDRATAWAGESSPLTEVIGVSSFSLFSRRCVERFGLGISALLHMIGGSSAMGCHASAGAAADDWEEEGVPRTI
jgi:hypothetical protein